MGEADYVNTFFLYCIYSVFSLLFHVSFKTIELM